MDKNDLSFTVEDLQKGKPFDILRSGTCLDPIWDSGETVTFAVVVGGIDDWAMYMSPITSMNILGCNWSVDKVARSGVKIHDRKFMKKLLGVSDEVMDRYRS